MAATNSSVVYIDPADKSIHYYSDNAGRMVHECVNYKGRDFDKDFFDKFTSALQELLKRQTPSQASNSLILLPDSAVMTDVMTFPTMKTSSLRSSVEAAVSGMFADRNDMLLQYECVNTSKQYASYCLTGVRKELIANLRSAAAAARFAANNVTFASEASAHAVAVLNPKIKDQNYILLDIKEKYSRITYIHKGMAVGFVSLPFGYSVLQSKKVAAEDMLFNHSVAELAVLNAREKAKAKSLSVIDNGADISGAMAGGNGDDGDEENPFAGSDSLNVRRGDIGIIKTLPKKTARKLPKYMLRPTPITEEGVRDENFRLFTKWVLCFLQGSERLQSLGEIKTVYVNMPDEFAGAIEAANGEKDENGIVFAPCSFDSKNIEVLRNLELYGALYAARGKNRNIF